MRHYFNQASTTNGKVIGMLIDAHLFTGLNLRLDNYLLYDDSLFLTSSSTMEAEENDPRLEINDSTSMNDIVDFIIDNGNKVSIVKYELDEVYEKLNKSLRNSYRYLHRKSMNNESSKDKKKMATHLFNTKKKLKVIKEWNQSKELTRV